MPSDRQLQEEIRQVRRAAARVTQRYQDLLTDYNQLAADVATMRATVDRVARVTITSGQAPVPTAALPGIQPVTVTLKTAMPDDTYSATATLSGGVNLLTVLTVVGITAQTPNTATVQVRNSGALSAGAIVTVHAVREA